MNIISCHRNGNVIGEPKKPSYLNISNNGNVITFPYLTRIQYFNSIIKQHKKKGCLYKSDDHTA